MYESFYGLRTKPFQLSPEPRFFFRSRVHQRALSYLRYGVQRAEGFIVVTGGVGTGKTTLAGALLKTLEHEDLVAAQAVTTRLEADDLVRMVAAVYGLPYETGSKSVLLRNLEEYFRTCAEVGRRVLLVVDEAQNLTDSALEELRMLSNFQWKGRPLLQSFLLGQEEFRSTLRSEGFEQLRQRVIAACHLQPLGLEETRGYIEHRLVTAGWSGDPSFSDDVYRRIYQFTGGIPRRINTLCDRLLLYGYLEKLHVIDRNALMVVIDEIADEQGDSWVERGASEEARAGASNGARRGEPSSADEAPGGIAPQDIPTLQPSPLATAMRSHGRSGDPAFGELDLLRRLVLEEQARRRVARDREAERESESESESESPPSPERMEN